MASSGSTGGYGDYSSLRSEATEPGGRRKKFAGYLKAANELRQSYMYGESSGYGSRDMSDDSGVEGPGAFPDAAVVRSGNEEMVLFPSYARKHVKGQARARPKSGDVDEQEYWRREWDRHQDDSAIVDADVRGWIYTPLRGQMTRRQRLTLGIARQISGLPASASQPGIGAAGQSQTSSRAESPWPSAPGDEELIAMEADRIVRKGEQEQRYARRGAFSEDPSKSDRASVYSSASAASSREPSPDRGRHRLSQVSLASTIDDEPEPIHSSTRQLSNTDPAKMTSKQLAAANSNLLTRLKPFMSTPLVEAPVTAFFYSENASRQHTVYTNASGHFSCRAALDFIPTHVRVLAGEKLSATEEVTVTSPKGVSLISDIDDTIKHSSITSPAREIFRNAFIRELHDLTIDGVKEWYNTMRDMGVQLHYVSNAPWQLYPVLTTYFKLANLPKGSFHMRQYSGLLQGIFEPVAERKKSSLEKILSDFPDRKFVLVGDSGEADLEVYTDIAVDNPGRVLGIFIRDVTTPVKSGYFDPSNGTSNGSRTPRTGAGSKSNDKWSASKRLSRPDDILANEDEDLRAAVAASLADMEEKTRRAKKSINPDSPSPERVDSPKPRPPVPPRRSNGRTPTQQSMFTSPEEDLIDFSEEPTPSQSSLAPPTRELTPRKTSFTNGAALAKPSPSPPPKPPALRSPSSGGLPTMASLESSSKPAPPRPRKPSSAVRPPSFEHIENLSTKPPAPAPPSSASQHQPSPLSQVTPLSPETKKPPPQLPTRPKTYRAITQGLSSAHSALVPASYKQPDVAMGQPRPAPSRAVTAFSTSSTAAKPSPTSSIAAAPLPPPRMRNVLSQSSLVANRKASNRVSGGWDDANLPGSPSEAGMGKKEFLWNQRWARAKSVLDRQGVTLRSWRVGSDVADVAVKLAERALREVEKEQERDKL